MKPWKTIEKLAGPDGQEWRLDERDGQFVIRVGGLELMSSRVHGSEEAMARLALKPLPISPTPRVLIGGLGMGYTLRAVLDALPAESRVRVVELSPDVVRWNRGVLGPLAGNPLEDKRVILETADVTTMLQPAKKYDAVLLDVDNGPSAMSQAANHGLYGPRGIALCAGAIKQKGKLVVWSAAHDPAYLNRLRKGGFDAEAVDVAVRAGSGARHVLFVGTKR